MQKDAVDDKILDLIKKDENISIRELSRVLGLPKEEVEKRIKHFSDTRQKILIVDDEMRSLLPLKRSLEAENYIVIEAYDGFEAVEKSKKELPELIILDIMLPGMDGMEVCSRLKKDPLTEKIPIIMLTAKDDVRDKVESFEIGADDYVTKPFHLSELKGRIKSVLRRSGNI